MKKKDFYDLAAKMEEACGDWENSEGLSEEAKASLFSKVEAMAAAEAGKETLKTRKKFRMRKRYVPVLAAVLVLMMGLGAVGERAWIADSSDLERMTEVTTKVNNEEKDSILLEEEEIYQEIAETLGIVPIRFGYLPEGMTLDSYTVMEGTGGAYLYYLYEDNVISIQMTKSSIEVSSNVQWDGTSRRLDQIENIYGHEIEAYCVDEKEHNYSADLIYGNGYYKISGCFEDEKEFLAILEEIYFKKL